MKRLSRSFGTAVECLTFVTLFTVLISGCKLCPLCDGVQEIPDPTMHNLAKEVTCLEDEIRECGSITIKEPDVWGDTNLMYFIQEYENEMQSTMNKYVETVQAYTARSDQATLVSTTSLGVGLSKASGGGAGGGGGGAGSGGSTLLTQAGNVGASVTSGDTTASLSSSSKAGLGGTVTSGGTTANLSGLGSTTSTPGGGGNSSSPAVATPAAPDTTLAPLPPDSLFQTLTKAIGAVKPAASSGISLEPTEKERQHSTYVYVNQALRQLNMGDDNSRMAGYGLYKLRIPVSVLPGRKTYKGYSAVVTMRAQLEIDANHLRNFFPKLAIADLVDQIAPIIESHWDSNIAPPPQPGPVPGLHIVKGPGGAGHGIPVRPATLEETVAMFGADNLNYLLVEARTQAKPVDAAPNQHPRMLEIRNFLLGYFNRMYTILEARHEYANQAGMILHLEELLGQGDLCTLQQRLCEWQNSHPKDCLESPSEIQTSWFLIVQSALQDMTIKENLRNLQRLGKLPHDDTDDAIRTAQFFNPDAPPETLRLWETLIREEFPIHVFTLTPLVEEENIYDAYSRSRELQLALAFALASGQINARQALSFSRELTLDVNTIALNRTAVAFAADNDTFGWYYYPRVQTPPQETTNIGALARLIWSTGPTRTFDLNHRELEPGIREGEVLVVMPTFVPTLRFDVTTNWEKLREPGKIKLGYDDMIDEGAHFQKVKSLATQVTDQDCYRAGDYERLVSRVEQLEKMLPLQSYHVRVPYHTDTPGTVLTDTGNAHLLPVIYDYYGLDYLPQAGGTTAVSAQVFITGRNFHPVLTRVIAGGSESFSSSPANPTTTPGSFEVEVISRELIRVHINSISPQLSANPVQLRVACPAGVSNPLFITLSPPAGATMGYGYAFGKPAGTGQTTADATQDNGSTLTVYYAQVCKDNCIQNVFVDAKGPTLLWRGTTGSALQPVSAAFELPGYDKSTLPACSAQQVTKPGQTDQQAQGQFQFNADDIRELGKKLVCFDITKPVPTTLTSTKVTVTPKAPDKYHVVEGVQTSNQVTVNFQLVCIPQAKVAQVTIPFTYDGKTVQIVDPNHTLGTELNKIGVLVKYDKWDTITLNFSGNRVVSLSPIAHSAPTSGPAYYSPNLPQGALPDALKNKLIALIDPTNLKDQKITPNTIEISTSRPNDTVTLPGDNLTIMFSYIPQVKVAQVTIPFMVDGATVQIVDPNHTLGTELNKIGVLADDDKWDTITLNFSGNRVVSLSPIAQPTPTSGPYYSPNVLGTLPDTLKTQITALVDPKELKDQTIRPMQIAISKKSDPSHPVTLQVGNNITIMLSHTLPLPKPLPK